jgi:hypothetical protein
MDKKSLAEELRTIEARFAGTGVEASADRIRARLAEARSREGDIVLKYTIPDPWEVKLFIAFCRRHGLAPFRRARMTNATVLVLAPEAFFQSTMWPQFEAMADALRAHLSRLTETAIREAIFDDGTPAPKRSPIAEET